MHKIQMGVTIEEKKDGWLVTWTHTKTGHKKSQWFATKKEADWFYKWKERDSDRSGYGCV